MPDLGFSHLALAVSDIRKSVDFYEKWTDLRVIHDRKQVAWLSDGTRSFALVLAENDVPHPLGPFSHIGIAVESSAKVHQIADRARRDGVLRSGPTESGPPVGTWCFIEDPDGHIVEFSHGQEVEHAVNESLRGSRQRLHSVAVIGSGTERHEDLSIPLGIGLARMNVDLVCGGGPGVMEAVAAGFSSVEHRAGRVIGILPAGDLPGYPNPHVDVVVRTHLPARGTDGTSMESRNHIVVLTGEIVVALPGGHGTTSECELARTYGRTLLHLKEPGEVDAILVSIARCL